MTFEELERELVQYFVDHYNQHHYPKAKIDPQFEVHRRANRWKDGLISDAEIIEERTLDICLLKQAHRKVQKYGTIQFETMIYIGNCLKDYIGEEISLRYDPRNIVTLLAYTAPKNGEPSEFIEVIKARHFEYEQMTFDELKWIGLSVVQLKGMLPQESMKLLPIRLCGLCYAQTPYHRMEWQYQSRLDCWVHGVKLLTKCPSCGERFSIPSRWVEGKCLRCGMGFKSMRKEQKHD